MRRTAPPTRLSRAPLNRIGPLVEGRLRPVQRALGKALRDRVAGEDAHERGRQIWGKPGERWFTPDDPVWRVHEDAAMFPGGVAALLLQSLHPAAMAGVAGHSGYKGDPWGRLKRTSDYIAVTTYGTVEDAEATIARVRAVHDRVRGKDVHGRPYRAGDPHLLRWVHVAEIWSFLNAHQAFGDARLSASEADRYVEQAGVAAARLGVEQPPSSTAELDAVLESYRPELELTAQASETIDFLLRTPPLPRPALPGYWMIAAGGIAVLPDWARTMIGLRVPPSLARPVGRLGASAVRWGMAGVEGRRSAPPPAQ